MKNYRQNDPRWANLPYAGGLMAASGCGSTSVADIVDLDSWIVAQWRASHSYASNGSGTYWGGIPAALRAFGVSAILLRSNCPEWQPPLIRVPLPSQEHQLPPTLPLPV